MRDDPNDGLPPELHFLASRLRESNQSTAYRVGHDQVSKRVVLQLEGHEEVVLGSKAALELGAALLHSAHRAVGERLVLCPRCSGLGILAPKGSLV